MGPVVSCRGREVKFNARNSWETWTLRKRLLPPPSRKLTMNSYNEWHEPTHLHLSWHGHLRGRSHGGVRLLGLHFLRPAQPEIPVRGRDWSAHGQPAHRYAAGVALAAFAGQGE